MLYSTMTGILHFIDLTKIQNNDENIKQKELRLICEDRALEESTEP